LPYIIEEQKISTSRIFTCLTLPCRYQLLFGGAWLSARIIFLIYDNGLQLSFKPLVERFRGSVLFLLLSWIFVLSGPVILSITPRVPVTNPEMLFLLAHVPRFYFFVVALGYWFGGFLYSASMLFLVWKVFRQNRPRLIALERAQKEEADHEQA
jgi:hypothetical protein